MSGLPDPLVVDDREAGIFRVHRATMTSEEIRALEQQRVFDRSWLFVGHESELAEPGEYRRRTIAGRSIMFVRGDESVLPKGGFLSIPARTITSDNVDTFWTEHKKLVGQQ